MSKELVIGSNRHETKVAVLEDDQVVEVYFQRGNEYSLAGSIHKGRVTRVLPGMQSAFVDLGLERDTFLYVSDFFEEHEDLDTVSDERVSRNDVSRNDVSRNERRERNPRYQQRAAIEEPAEAVPASRPVLVPASRELVETPEDEQATGPIEPLMNGEESEARSGDPAADQNARAGDRRGRRSRRRRQRGRGFPENKYAQRGSGAAPSEPSHDVPPGLEEGPLQEVILLPGESLAKYRTTPVSVLPLSMEDSSAEEPDTGYADAGGETESGLEETSEDESAEDQEIDAEAEELELAEKVLAHHDDETPEEVEEKIAEVKQDIPSDSTDAPAQASGGAPIEVLAFGPEAQVDPAPQEVVEEHFSESWHDEVEALETIEIDEYEVIPLDEEVGHQNPGQSHFAEERQLAPTNEQLAEGNAESKGHSEGGAQTASVREQGGRSMHRLSRRMRRRRGGNRLGSSSQESSGNAKPIEMTAAATGAAVALEPEMRPEASGEVADERPAKAERVYPLISDLLKPGQEIIVQIAKEPLGQKGARITSHIALPGRYVVFMPSVNHLGVSRKVASDEERQRLKRILQAHHPGTGGGFIVRTAGEGVPEEEIAADMRFLYTLWQDIRQKAEKKPAPALLHYDLDIVQRILRDQVTDEFKAIWVDNEDLYESVLTFMQRFQPALVNRVKMYTRTAPIFDAFNITQELEKALRPKVWLKSGGYIVINQTEALVAIDINTGKYVGKSNRLEDTIVKTNTEAVKEIVRQIRLRDLGGIIVVDFIDMDERKNRQKVMQALEEAMRADKAPYKILQFNDFGLVAITRKRVKQSLERTLCMPCPYCEGAGYVKSVGTVIGEILVEAQKIARAIDSNDVVLRVHPDVAKMLKSSSNQYLEELEEVLKRPVLVVGDQTLHHQKFDLA